METWIAALAALAAVVSAIFAGRSHRVARRAAASSEESAKTAQQALRLEELKRIDELKPHLVVKLGHHADPESRIPYPKAAFIHNFGKGIAENIKLKVEVVMSDRGRHRDRENRVNLINREWGQGNRTIASGGKEILAAKGEFLRDCIVMAEYQDAGGTPYGPTEINEARGLTEVGDPE